MGKVAVIGMVGNSAFLSVDHFHADGETVAASAIHFEPGGKGFNQAVAAARWGAEVAFLGAVGEQYIREIEDFLRADGIFPVLPQKAEPTAFASILTNADGANQVTVYQGAQLSVEDVDAFSDTIVKADVLLLNNEVPQAVNRRAIEIAKKNHTFVILNPAPAVVLEDFIADNADLLTPNEHEHIGLESRENLIVTLGAKGCLWKATGQVFPSLKIRNVVDTTGAGDTFNGVLAACIAQGEPLQSAIGASIAASGVSVTRQYAATAIPTRQEVLEYQKASV